MKKPIYFSPLLTAMVLLSFSCQKGNPVGPTNVYYSDWITPASFTASVVSGATHFDADIPASHITQSALDNSVVLVYGKLNGYDPGIWPTDQVSVLPVTIFYQAGTFQFTDIWSAEITPGNIGIDFQHNVPTNTVIAPGYQFRYVIIPGNTHIMATVNTKNYAEVKQALHVKD